MKAQTLLTGMAVLSLALGTSLEARAARARQANNEAQAEQRLAREAKVTKEQAQAVAIKRAPGNIESAELEREHGRIVYSFDIRNSKGTITEVQVSAVTGRVVRVEHESRKQEAAEKRKEQTGKH